MKYTIELGEAELQLIKYTLDFYSRIGIGQFEEILDHPTFQKSVENNCIPNKSPEVGDHTLQGKILEIKDGQALINGSVKDGMWCEDPEWKPLDKVKLAPDWERYHETRHIALDKLTEARNLLYGQFDIGKHGSWGIYNPEVHPSAVIAYHLHQVIRHELWKKLDRQPSYTVDSYPADACTMAHLPIPDFKIETNKIDS